MKLAEIPFLAADCSDSEPNCACAPAKVIYHRGHLFKKSFPTTQAKLRQALTDLQNLSVAATCPAIAMVSTSLTFFVSFVFFVVEVLEIVSSVLSVSSVVKNGFPASQ